MKGMQGSDLIIISGLVVDEGRNPRSGVVVRILDTHERPLAKATTGSDGNFRLELKPDRLGGKLPDEIGFELLEDGERVDVVQQRGPTRAKPGDWRVQFSVAG